MPVKEDPPAGVPEWILTYGDMMSLLLTFFIMLVSLSEMKAEEKYKAMLEAIYERLGYRSAPIAPPGKSFPLNSVIEGLKQLGSHTMAPKGRGGVKAQGPQGEEYRVFRRKDGTALTISGGLAFGDGTQALTPEVRTQLQSVVKVLSGKPNKIEVRGHASNRPLPPDSPYQDRYDLSYARARQVYDYLLSQGITLERLRIGAAGAMSSQAMQDPLAEARGDRVEILVFDTVTNDFSGERDVRD